MDPMSWQDNLHDYIDFLKQKYDLSDEQIREELVAEKLPTDIFTQDLTPLQAASKHLVDAYKKTPKEIAKLLGRTTAEVEKYLAATLGKPPLPAGGVNLPATLFADKVLSASEHLVEALSQRGNTNADIARLLGKHEQTIWTLHYRIQKKRGEQL